MPTYVVLSKYTDQGAKAIGGTVDRVLAAREDYRKHGLTLSSMYWTHGQYDMVAVVEAPSEQAMTAALFKLAALGNLRTETLRAFSESEVADAIKQMR
jgi:uncharacterized protein with GYD domain